MNPTSVKLIPTIKSLTGILASAAVFVSASTFAQTTTTWSGAGGDNNWGTGANWGGSPPPVGTSSDLVFAGTTRTNPFNDYTAFDDFRSIFFAAGAGTFSITGNAIDLFGKIENNSTNAQTFALDIGTGTASGGFIEINPISGNLNINSTNIFLGNNQMRVWGNNGNTLSFGASTIIQGAGASVAINQNSTVIYQSAHTYTGDTFINAGVLRFASGSSANSSTIRLGDTSGTNTSAIQVAGGVTLTNGTIEVRSGSSGIKTLAYTEGSGTGTVGRSITLNSSASADVASGGTLQVTGAISGAGTNTFTKTGSGTLVLGGSNTYSGATTISNGALRAGSTNGLSTSSTFSVSSGALLDLGGFSSTIKNLTASGGTITNSTGSATLRVADALGSTLTTNLFTGNLGLQVYGGGTLNAILGNSSNNYSGGTILGNGSGLTFTRWFGSGTVGSGSPGAVTNGIFGTGAITIGAATTDRSQIFFLGTTTINNDLVVNSATGGGVTEIGAFRVESIGNVIAGAINANLADATFNAASSTARTITVSGAISGASGLRVTAQGAGGLTVTLSNTGTANSYAGNTTIDGNGNAVLALGAANQIANGAGKGNLVMSNAKFEMRGFSETINGLSGTGTVDGVSGTPTLTVGDNNATSTFSGNIVNTAGALALTKTGTGTLTLAGANTYSGATTVSAGSLLIDGAGSVGASSVLDVAGGAALNVSAVAGGFVVGSSQTLQGSGTVVGNITIDGVLSPGNSIGTLSSAGNVTWNSGNSWVFELGGAGPSIGAPGSSDLLLVGGDFLRGTGAGSAWTFDFAGTGADGWYKLAEWSGTSDFEVLNFSGVNLGGAYTSEFAIQDNALYVNVVPEPSTYALLAFAAAGLGAHVLRRRRCR